MEARNIIVGATGQVGSSLVSEIRRSGFPVRAVVRNLDKVSDRTIEIKNADLLNLKQLTEAFKNGSTVFLITPENPASNDIMGETEKIVANFRQAIKETGIERIVGLSCIGAHIHENTGNILMSRILEQGLADLDAEKIFIRPSYYFSNWLAYFETIEKHGVLPSFFPVDLKIEMNSPVDLAKFIARVMTETLPSGNHKIYELTGPQKYSSRDVAGTFSKLLGKVVTVQHIKKAQRKEMLKTFGFTENTATSLSAMTQAVIDNKTVPERPEETVKLPTTLEKYIEEHTQKN